MKVVVTGGAGYIGSIVSIRLAQLGHMVTVRDTLRHKQQEVVESMLAVCPCLRFDNRDIRFRWEFSDVDMIIHLAALVGKPECDRYHSTASEVNVGGTAHIIDEMDKHGYDGKFILASTCSNYGIFEGKADEETPLNPQSHYAKTKVAAEEYMQKDMKMEKYSGWKGYILRFGTAHGLSPRMRFDLTVNQFALEHCLGHKLQVYNLDAWRPYIHVIDISEAIMRVKEPGVYNVATQNLTKRMVLDELSKAAGEYGVNFTTVSGGSDNRNYRVSADKFRTAHDFHPLMEVEDTARGIVESYNEGLFHRGGLV